MRNFQITQKKRTKINNRRKDKIQIPQMRYEYKKKYRNERQSGHLQHEASNWHKRG